MAFAGFMNINNFTGWPALRSLLATCVALFCLTGCSTLGYYWQSVSGHLHMLNAARPVNERLVTSVAIMYSY